MNQNCARLYTSGSSKSFLRGSASFSEAPEYYGKLALRLNILMVESAGSSHASHACSLAKKKSWITSPLLPIAPLPAAAAAAAYGKRLGCYQPKLSKPRIKICGGCCCEQASTWVAANLDLFATPKKTGRSALICVEHPCCIRQASLPEHGIKGASKINIVQVN